MYKIFRSLLLLSLFILLVHHTATPVFATAPPTPDDGQNPVYLPLVARPGLNVRISEFMASNGGVAFDEDGESADWIEIHNDSPYTLDLDGWYLTDSRSDLTKWRFPARTLAPNGYLLIFASGKEKLGAELHASFRLEAEGEYLALVQPDGITVASAFGSGYSNQFRNVSFGLDRLGNQRYFRTPTPGQPNSTEAADAGPTLADATHTPNVPVESNDMHVTVRLPNLSESGASAVSLRYRIMYGDEVHVPMADDGQHGDGAAGDGIFGATIPASAYRSGEMVRYYVTATDAQGQQSRLPLSLPSGNGPQYYGTMVQAEVATALPVLFWFVESPRAAGTDAGTSSSLFYDGKFYDNVFTRLRGHRSSDWPKPNYKFDFNSGHHFYYAPDAEPVEEFNLNSTYSDKSYIRPLLAADTYREAGVPSFMTFPVRVQQNGAFHSVAVFVEQMDERFLRRVGLNDTGALYKMRSSLVTSAASDETAKAAKRNRTHENKDDLRHFIHGLNIKNATARRNYLWDNVNVPGMINYLAATAIMHDNDHLYKNYYLYRDTEVTNEWTMLPWDKDLTFGRNYIGGTTILTDELWATKDPYSHPLFGSEEYRKVDGYWNLIIDRLYSDRDIRKMYLRRLRTLMDQLLNHPNTEWRDLYYEQRMAELHALMAPDVEADRERWRRYAWGESQSFFYALKELENEYLEERREHLFETHGDLIPRAQPHNARIEIRTVESVVSNERMDEEYVALFNPNDYDVDLSGWRLAGAVEHTFQGGVVLRRGQTLFVSPDVRAFRSRVSSPTGGEGRFVQGNYRGRLSHASGTVLLHNAQDALVDSFAYRVAPSAVVGKLIISELHYHPRSEAGLPAEQMEFIELQNVDNRPINLAGFRFVDGIDFTFGEVVLPPNARIVLARGTELFAERYPQASVYGTYAQRLDNDGERLILLDNGGAPVFAFAYRDRALWPPLADGAGYSLVLAQPLGNPGNPCSWRSSTRVHGSPGAADPAPNPQNTTCAAPQFLPLISAPER